MSTALIITFRISYVACGRTYAFMRVQATFWCIYVETSKFKYTVRTSTIWPNIMKTMTCNSKKTHEKKTHKCLQCFNWKQCYSCWRVWHQARSFLGCIFTNQTQMSNEQSKIRFDLKRVTCAKIKITKKKNKYWIERIRLIIVAWISLFAHPINSIINQKYYLLWK